MFAGTFRTAAVRALPFQFAPALDLDFTTEVLDPRITFARASAGTYFDAAGVLQTAAVDVPRFDHNVTTFASLGFMVESARTNGIRNPRAEGATVGVVGSGGVMPTYWSVDDAAGLTSTIVGTGSEDGIPYIDLRFAGTATGSQVIVAHDTITGIAAAQTQRWVGTVFTRLVGGTMANVTSLQSSMVNYTSAQAVIVNKTQNLTPLTNAPLRTRREFNQTSGTLGAGTVSIRFHTLINFAIGAEIDLTLRIGAPQMEIGRHPTSLILPAVGAPGAATRADDIATMPFTTEAGVGLTIGVLGVVAYPSTSTTQYLLQLDAGVSNKAVYISVPSTVQTTLIGAASEVNVFINPFIIIQQGTLLDIVTALVNKSSMYGKVNNSYGSDTTLVAGNKGTLPAMTTLRFGNSLGTFQTGVWLQRVRIWRRAFTQVEIQRT